MSNHLYFQFVGPITIAMFSVGFGLIYANNRRLKEAQYWCISYVCGALALTLDICREFLPPAGAIYSTNTLFFLTTAFFTAGLIKRTSARFPIGPVLAIAGALFIGMTYYTLVQPDIFVRTVLSNCANGLVVMLALPILFQHRSTRIDHFIFWLMCLNCAQFYLRTAGVWYFSTEQLTMENYKTSTYGLAMHFTMSIVAATSAVTFFVALGMRFVQDLKNQSRTDFLTGLANRLGYDEGMADTLQRANRSSTPVSLVIADIDHFKSVNDQYGHMAGDIAIAEMGRLLKTTARETDICARIGGEEFCVVLWNCDLTSARLFAEAMRTAIAAARFDGLPEDCQITASFGVAQMKPQEAPHALFQRADTALYKAKDRGRDRVVVSRATKTLDKVA